MLVNIRLKILKLTATPVLQKLWLPPPSSILKRNASRISRLYSNWFYFHATPRSTLFTPRDSSWIKINLLTFRRIGHLYRASSFTWRHIGRVSSRSQVALACGLWQKSSGTRIFQKIKFPATRCGISNSGRLWRTSIVYFSSQNERSILGIFPANQGYFGKLTTKSIAFQPNN